jgi:MSHA biogenesis protein MshJ
MDLTAQSRKAAGAYEQRPTAEKIIIAVLLVAVIGWLWLITLSDPLRSGIAEAERDIRTSEARMVSLEARAAQARAEAEEDPEQVERDRISRLVDQQQEVDVRIEELAGRLVPPDAMTRLLTTVLNEQSGLELQHVQNMAPRPLRSTEAGDEPVRGQVYRHGLVLEFRGSYFNTLRYLQYLESLSESFFWDSLHFHVHEWPMSSVKLELHTLSSEECFVGFGI